MHSWKRNQAAITAAAFVGFTGHTLVMPFLPLYIRELGVTDVGDIAIWTGVTLGVSPAIAGLTGPLWGRVGDRFGNKLLVQRSLVSFILVMTAMAYVTRPWHLFALRVLQGFFAGYGALNVSMAALSAPREKMATAIGTVQTAQRLGPALGPVIGGLLAPAVGLRNAFLVAAGVYGVALVMVTTLYREPPRASLPVDGRRRTPFASILAFENFLLVMLVLFGLQIVDRSFGPVLPLHLGQLGYAPSEVPLAAGILFSMLAFSGALGNQLSSRLLKRHSPRFVIAWGRARCGHCVGGLHGVHRHVAAGGFHCRCRPGHWHVDHNGIRGWWGGDPAGRARHRVRLSDQCVADRSRRQPGAERAARRAEHPCRLCGWSGDAGHPGGRGAAGHGGAQPARRVSALVLRFTITATHRGWRGARLARRDD